MKVEINRNKYNNNTFNLKQGFPTVWLQIYDNMTHNRCPFDYFRPSNILSPTVSILIPFLSNEWAGLEAVKCLAAASVCVCVRVHERAPASVEIIFTGGVFHLCTLVASARRASVYAHHRLQRRGSLWSRSARPHVCFCFDATTMRFQCTCYAEKWTL